MSPSRVRTFEVRQLRSTTSPSRSSARIQSPGSNGRSPRRSKPDAIPLRVGCRASEMTSDVTPRAANRPEMSTLQTVPTMSHAATRITSSRGRSSTSCGMLRAPGISDRRLARSTTSAMAWRHTATTASTIAVARTRMKKLSVSTSATNTSSTQRATRGRTQPRRVATGRSKAEPRWRSRSWISPATTISSGSTMMRTAAQTATGSPKNTFIATAPRRPAPHRTTRGRQACRWPSAGRSRASGHVRCGR